MGSSGEISSEISSSFLVSTLEKGIETWRCYKEKPQKLLGTLNEYVIENILKKPISLACQREDAGFT